MKPYRPIDVSDYPITQVLIDTLSVQLLPSQTTLEFTDKIRAGSINLIKATESDMFNGNYESVIERQYTDYSPTALAGATDDRNLSELLKGMYIIHGNGFYAYSKGAVYKGLENIDNIIYHTFEYTVYDSPTDKDIIYRQIAVDLITLKHGKYLTPSFGLVANAIIDNDKITELKIANENGYEFKALSKAQIESLLLK